MKTTVIVVLCVVALLIAAGVYSEGRGGGTIMRWLAVLHGSPRH